MNKYAQKLFFAVPIALIVGILYLNYIPSFDLDLMDFHGDDQMLIGFLRSVGTSNYQILLYPEHYKFRPISMLLYFFEWSLFKQHWNYYVYFNFTLLLICGMLSFEVAKKFVNSYLSAACALVFVSSKFLTYSVWNITGSFETLSLAIFLLYIISLLSNLNPLLIASLGLLLLLTNERYLPIELIAPLVIKRFSVRLLVKIYLIIFFISVYAAIRYAFQIPLLVGTQTDNLLQSFDFYRLISHIFKSILEVIGISTGPMYLVGVEFPTWLEFQHWASSSKRLLFWQMVNSFGIIIILIASKYRNFSFIALSVVAIITASVTFRVELRWLSPAYFFVILYAFCGAGNIYKSSIKMPLKFLCSIFIISLLVSNLYFLDVHAKNFYFADKISKKI